MSTWKRRGKSLEAWASPTLWKRRRYWRRASESSAMAARVAEQAQMRKEFMGAAGRV